MAGSAVVGKAAATDVAAIEARKCRREVGIDVGFIGKVSNRRFFPNMGHPFGKASRNGEF